MSDISFLPPTCAAFFEKVKQKNVRLLKRGENWEKILVKVSQMAFVRRCVIPVTFW